MEYNNPSPNDKIETKRKHPSLFDLGTLLLIIILSALGAIVGLELITRVGTTPNTSVIGAMVAIIIAQVPIAIFKKFKDINNQNLVQTAISGATFSAANGLLLPISIIFLMGETRLIWPMLIGASLAVITDATILYSSFDSDAFPAEAPWPSGIATAEAIKSAQEKGKSGLILLSGLVAGAVGKFNGIPMDLFGVAFIGNMFALTAFAIGLLVRGYSTQLFGVDINTLYVPHGVMIGAGVVTLIQIAIIIFSKKESKYKVTRSSFQLKKGLMTGFGAYLIIAIILAIGTGIITKMSLGMLLFWIVFAAGAAIVSELIVGISAMHSGWFPAFATALIFLVVGMLLGFPPLALAVLVGFTAATGPCFADMAYDFKAGYVLRGSGADPEYEKEGRKQQYYAELIAFAVAIIIVGLTHNMYFSQDLIPPAARTYYATIQAGSNPEIARMIMLWAIPGAIVQFIGGPSKQLGILFATGLLINFPIAGVTVLVGLIVRAIIMKVMGKEESKSFLYVFGAGSITGSALVSFFTSTTKLFKAK